MGLGGSGRGGIEKSGNANKANEIVSMYLSTFAKRGVFALSVAVGIFVLSTAVFLRTCYFLELVY